jgi:hypothetical protein
MMTGDTVTSPGDLNMGGYQKLSKPKSATKPSNFQTPASGNNLPGKPSLSGAGAKAMSTTKNARPVRNLKKTMTRGSQPVNEKISRFGRQ